MDPLDTHPANPTVLAEWERRFMDLAREVVDHEAVTSSTFDPAVASWEGIAAAELQAAPEPVRDRAYEVASHLTWAATATNVWAEHVQTFNTIVGELRRERDLVPVEVERYLADHGWMSFPVFDQDAIRERRRGELIRDLYRRWGDAYEAHIEEGSCEVVGMFTRGPTWENLELARRMGTLSTDVPLLRFFAVGWEAAVAPAEALRLAELFNDPSYRPTADEIEQFHDLLGRYAGDEAFWFHFLGDLGLEGLLTLNGNLAVLLPDSQGDAMWNDQLAKTVGEIQVMLGSGLAIATTRRGVETPYGVYIPAEHELDPGWLVELTTAGRQLYAIGGAGTAFPDGFEVHGYQLLGPLLGHGEYDDRFLRMVGGDLVDFEIAQGGSGIWPVPSMGSLHGVPVGSDIDGLRLDWSNGWGMYHPAGFDPMGGLMSAMERNPQGALEVLDGWRSDDVGKWSDGTSKEGTLPEDIDHRLPRLDYLLTDREWPTDWVRTPQNAAIGLAMESHGHSVAANQFGGVLVEVSRLEDERAVDVVELIVYEVNTDEQEMGYANGEVPGEGATTSNVENDVIHPMMREPLAEVMAEYIWDVNRAVHEERASIPGGRDAVFDRTHMIRFLADLGKDEAAHRTVLDAQVVYTAASYDYYLSGEADLEHDSPTERRTAAEDVAIQYGSVVGALDAGAEAAAWHRQEAEDEATNRPLEAGFVIADLVVGTAADSVPGAGYLAGEMVSAVLDDLEASAAVDGSGLAAHGIVEMMGDSRHAAADLAMAAVYSSADLEELGKYELLDEHGQRKPVETWTVAEEEGWQDYLDRSGRAYAKLATSAGVAYDHGVGEAERALGIERD